MVDVFSGSAHESDAKDYDTRGIVFSAVKADQAKLGPGFDLFGAMGP